MFRREKGEWRSEDILPGRLNRRNYCWHPAIGEGPSGTVTVACDAFSQENDYDLYVQSLDSADAMVELRVTQSDKFEARPSLACDPQGRIWIAFEVGPENWGKDYGAL